MLFASFTSFFSKTSQQLGRLHPLLFIYVIWFTSYAVLLPLVALDSVVVSDALHQSDGPKNLPAFGMLGRLLVGSVLTPLVETAIFQWAPIRVLRTWLKLPAVVAVGVSAVAFGAAHTYSIGYVVFTFLIGLVLAAGFVARDYPSGKPYLLICVVHALRNAVSSLLM
jgi:hypothetical protein